MLTKGLAIPLLLLALEQTPPAALAGRLVHAALGTEHSLQTFSRTRPITVASFPAHLLAAVLPTPAQQNPDNAPDASSPRQTAPRPAAQPPVTQPPAGAARPNASRPNPARPSAQPAQPPPASSPLDCNGFPCDTSQPRPIVVTTPAATPAPAPWTLHEKIAWAAYVVLAILGYVGIMLALSALKKIERQTSAAEAAAEAAHESASAALLSSQAMVSSERPWLLVSVEPSPNVENGFTVVTTNRGRSPAQIVATVERLRIAPDETKLPQKPEFGDRDPVAPMVPIILLPGESTPLKPFSRADARALCESDEQFARIESWDEKVFLYGRVVYRDLIAAPDKQTHQTDWCCWYIHGRQKSGLVVAGGPEYNQHT
jgi:hypothetical protein